MAGETVRVLKYFRTTNTTTVDLKVICSMEKGSTSGQRYSTSKGLSIKE